MTKTTEQLDDTNTIVVAGLYGIYDRIAELFVGNEQGILIFKHEAAAIRFFHDVASNPKSIVGSHHEDFELVRLGWLTNHNTITSNGNHDVVLTGKAWAATHAAAAKPNLNLEQ